MAKLLIVILITLLLTSTAYAVAREVEKKVLFSHTTIDYRGA
jgi:hypothetical protein